MDESSATDDCGESNAVNEDEDVGDKKRSLRSMKRNLALNELKKLKQQFKKGVRDSMRGKSLRKPERLLEVCSEVDSQCIAESAVRFVALFFVPMKLTMLLQTSNYAILLYVSHIINGSIFSFS